MQICQGLRREFPQDPERHLVPETIYQAADGVAGRIDGPTPAAPAGW